MPLACSSHTLAEVIRVAHRHLWLQHLLQAHWKTDMRGKHCAERRAVMNPVSLRG